MFLAAAPFPGANLPGKKRSSHNSILASSAARTSEGGGVKDRPLFDNSRLSGSSSGSGGGGDNRNRNSFESLEEGGDSEIEGEDARRPSGGGGGRSSSESESSRDGDKDNGLDSICSVSKPRREVINWSNLDLYTVRSKIHVVVAVDSLRGTRIVAAAKFKIPTAIGKPREKEHGL